ncbi:MAG: hypothetical protein J5786_01685 [Clostridiales bacterium]|nr:hypothetical protein [Clostridiales bacterium]
MKTENRTAVNLIKKTALGLMIMTVLSLFCGCGLANRYDLIIYARLKHGDCEFIREEVTGKGDDKVRTVYLKDKESGVEYKAEAYYTGLWIDGGSGLSSPDKRTTFSYDYTQYINSKAADEIKAIEDEYKVKVSMEYLDCDLTFNSCRESDEILEITERIDSIFAKYDIKSVRDPNYGLYYSNEESIGHIDLSKHEIYLYEEYYAINYVNANYDPEARWICSWNHPLDYILPKEKVDEIFANNKDKYESREEIISNYFDFEDKNGNRFSVVDMDTSDEGRDFCIVIKDMDLSDDSRDNRIVYPPDQTN